MLEIKHCHYDHQVQDPAKYPGMALFKVLDGQKLVAVVREGCGAPEEQGCDLRVDCAEESLELRSTVDGYFPGRKVAYLSHGSSWSWRDNGTYETMPWD